MAESAPSREAPAPKGAVTLKEAVSAYLEGIAQARTENIVANHTSVSRRFLTYFPGRRTVDDLRRQDLLAFLDWLTHKRGSYTAHTYNLGVEFLKRLGRFCVAQGWTEESPADTIAYREIEKAVPAVLTLEELTRLWDAAREDVFHAALVGLLGQVGLKKRELLNLRFADLEMDGPNPVAVIRYSGKLRKKSRRLPLSREIAMALREYQMLREAEGPSFTSLDPLVPVTGRQVNNILAGLCRQAGIRRANPQILRDTAAVRLLQAGHPPEDVAGQLGYTPRGYLLEFLPRFGPWIGALREP